MQKFLSDIFGKEHIPKIGKRYLSKKIEVDLHALEIQNPLKDIKDAYSQNIISFPQKKSFVMIQLLSLFLRKRKK